MIEQICIYDARGNRICYTNHALRGKATLPYQLWYTPKTGRAVPMGSGWLKKSTPCLEKLEIVIAAALAFGWRDWTFLTHEHTSGRHKGKVRTSKKKKK